MRRPALLAFTLVTLGASLPAEVRECVPLAWAGVCARATEAASPCVTRAKACPTARATKSAAAAATRCPAGTTVRPTASRSAGTPCCTPATGDVACRLHPTPPATPAQAPPASEPPAVTVTIASLPVAADPHVARRGWVDPPLPGPRAVPRTAPFAPRPPPFPG